MEAIWHASFRFGLGRVVLLPGPSTLDLELQGQAEEGRNQDDQAENDDVVEGGMYDNSANMSPATRNSRPRRIDRPIS